MERALPVIGDLEGQRVPDRKAPVLKLRDIAAEERVELFAEAAEPHRSRRNPRHQRAQLPRPRL